MARNTRYENTINNLKSASHVNHIHYEFYEKLFEKSSFNCLEKFLGIPLTEPDFKSQVNESQKAKRCQQKSPTNSPMNIKTLTNSFERNLANNIRPLDQQEFIEPG